MALYVPTTWVDDSAPGISATQLNRMEAGIAAALGFTEAWQELTIGGAGAWTNVALSSYGVAAGDVVFVAFKVTVGGPLSCGARTDGSALERRVNIHGESMSFTLPVLAVGATAIIECYVENTTDAKAYLLGWYGV